LVKGKKLDSLEKVRKRTVGHIKRNKEADIIKDKIRNYLN
jgi:hypothetical protein